MPHTLLQRAAHMQQLILKNISLVGGAAGIAALISRLRHITYLTLDQVSGINDTAAVYAAVGAIAGLKHLDLGDTFVPPSAWPHLFPSHRRLQLTTLILPESYTGSGAVSLSAVVRCCPMLRVLGVERTWGLAPQFPALQQLPALTSLSVRDVDDDAVKLLVQLTGLQSLRAAGLQSMTKNGLDKMIDLRQLTSLELVGCSSSMAAVLAKADPRLANQRSGTWTCRSKGPKPVWAQLLACFIAEPRPLTAAQVANCTIM